MGTLLSLHYEILVMLYLVNKAAVLVKAIHTYALSNYTPQKRGEYKLFDRWPCI